MVCVIILRKFHDFNFSDLRIENNRQTYTYTHSCEIVILGFANKKFAYAKFAKAHKRAFAYRLDHASSHRRRNNAIRKYLSMSLTTISMSNFKYLHRPRKKEIRVQAIFDDSFG